MVTSLIQAFEQIIEPQYQLPKSGNMFKITETDKHASNKCLGIGGCKGFGFSLDKKGKHPWGFIQSSPLAGIVSVCDGILILHYKKQNYIIVLDLKSSHSYQRKNLKQIQSSCYCANGYMIY